MPRRPAIPPDKGRITSEIVVDRAKLRCECLGGCGEHKNRCVAVEPRTHPLRAGQIVKLVVVHLDYNDTNWSYANLKALCQPCRKAHADAKPKIEPLRPEYGGSLFGTELAPRKETPLL
jgi:hypothetical protein